MAATPKINLRDGSGTTQRLVFTTNEEFIIIDGVIDLQTVSLQVSINGAPFSSDATLVKLDETKFSFPNPDSYPDGFALDLGETTITFRSVDIIGSVSSTATVTVTRIARIASGDSLIPSGVRVNRLRNAIDILVAKTEVDQPLEFRGFNIYASTSPAGTTGYIRVNEKPVTAASIEFEEDILDLDSNSTIFANDSASFTRVRVTREDNFGTELSVVLDRRTDIALIEGSLKFTQTLQSRTLQEFIVFRHNRQGGTNIINSDQFIDVDSNDPLYYVVSGVYYDTSIDEEFETPFSQEVLGAPLVIDTAIRNLPERTQLQVIRDFIGAVQRVNEEISLLPGSTTRDVSIDPFASETERVWFIADFVHRSQSFATLLQVDDANQDGVSDPVVSSAYKQALKAALGLTTDAAVQNLIDTQFDKLANNVQSPRLPGRPSVGQAVFFTATKPTQDIPIPSGTIVSTDADETNGLPAVRYLVGGTYVLPAADADAFFNFDTRRYEVIVDIVAESVGETGDRPAGSIKNVVGSAGGLSVTNTEATVFGRFRETNAELAARCQLAYVAVDSGTEGGYAKTTAAQSGIIKTKIVKSGDSLMMRDYDPVRRKHIGGKVDVWVQGLLERTVSERFAFSFLVARDIRCQIVDIATLTFRVLDARVTTDTPIVEILDNSSKGFGVRNATTGQNYDLTGVVLIDYQTFKLDTTITQPATSFDDVIYADYRFRSVNSFVFSVQPVRRVTSVVGEASGTLQRAQYDLYKTDDPLLEGESTRARNNLIVRQLNGLPSGGTIQVNDESHVMIGFFEEKLKNIGINSATIRVFNEPRTVEYDGPGTASPDFEVIEGTATSPVKIVRTAASAIVSGQTVVIDYEHDENFTVTYVVNDLLQQLQRTLNARRHVTADVLAKQTVQNSIDIETTVQLKAGASKDRTDPAVRTSVSRELNQKIIGQGSAQSDIINAVDSTSGVDFQVLPLARMGYADGSVKLRETVLSSSARLSSLDIGFNIVFILLNPLKYPTTDGGGLVTEHRGVFQDDETMVMESNLFTVGQNPNQAFIIGAEGAIITGYSDDATLIADGFTDTDDILAERLRRTANHVVVSLSGSGEPQDAPEKHAYTVSYTVRDDVGPHDIAAAPVEFLQLGNFVVTYREAS